MAVEPTAVTADTGTLTLDNQPAPSMSVRLVTHTAASEGFRAHYTAHYQQYCSGTKMFTSATGNITDGSNGHDYNNFTNCRFRVMLNSEFNTVHIHINSLDLEDGHDYLYIYNNTVSAANLLTTLTGHIADTSFLLDTRRLTLVLETDEAGTDAGFDIDYSGGHTGVDDFTSNELTIWPNPATNHVRLAYPTPIQYVEIRNAEGQTVYSENSDSQELTIQTSQLPAGIYLMTVRTQTGIITKKIVKM